MIEMIGKLLQEANEAAEHKAFRDKEFGETNSSKAEKEQRRATVNSRMETVTAASSKLKEGIKGLATEVGEIDAAVVKDPLSREDRFPEGR